MSYSEWMRYYHYNYPYVIPTVDCISPEWFKHIILPVLKTAENDYPFQCYESLLACINDNIFCAAEDYLTPDPLEWVWRFTKVTPVNNLRAVILGQDPYPGTSSNGLAFSCANPREVGGSLQIIMSAIEEQTGNTPNFNGDLTRWARQGVLLLDSIPTVGSHPRSHERFGWLELSNMILYCLSDYYEHMKDTELFVMAWGHYGKMIANNVLFDVDVQHQLQSNLFRQSQVNIYKRHQTHSRRKAINDRFHTVLTSVHPSPRNGGWDFISNGHFSQFEEFSEYYDLPPIRWW